MSESAYKNTIETELPPGWILNYRVELSHGPIFAAYEHQSGTSLRLVPKIPYRQPWSQFEYFIEYIDDTRTYIAPSRRIYYFHLAKEIAVGKMREVAEETK